MMRCCFDKRVWIGFGALAAGLLIANPRAGWAALPVLAALACPVSMLFMRCMRQGTGTAMADPGDERIAGAGGAQGDLAAEIARLRREIRQLKTHAGGSASAAAGDGQAAGARSGAGRADPAVRRVSAIGG